VATFASGIALSVDLSCLSCVLFHHRPASHSHPVVVVDESTHHQPHKRRLGVSSPSRRHVDPTHRVKGQYAACSHHCEFTVPRDLVDHATTSSRNTHITTWPTHKHASSVVDSLHPTATRLLVRAASSLARSVSSVDRTFPRAKYCHFRFPSLFHPPPSPATARHLRLHQRVARVVVDAPRRVTTRSDVRRRSSGDTAGLHAHPLFQRHDQTRSTQGINNTVLTCCHSMCVCMYGVASALASRRLHSSAPSSLVQFRLLVLCASFVFSTRRRSPLPLLLNRSRNDCVSLSIVVRRIASRC
jgi:hypothetical protein